MSDSFTPEQIAKIAKLIGTRCPECTQKVVIYKYTFNEALLHILGLIVNHVQGSAINWFKTSELPLTRSQYTNGTKLKIWGLIAHSDDHLRWCLTPLGKSFYYGHTPISKYRERFDDQTWSESHEKVFSTQIDPSLSFQESWVRSHQSSLQPTLPL